MLGRNVRSQQIQIGLTGFPFSQWNIETENTLAEVTEAGFLTASFNQGNYYKNGDFAFVNTTDKGVVYLQIVLDSTTNTCSLVEPQLTSFVESTVLAGSAVSLTTAVSADVTTITLTAGEWDVYGNVGYISNTGTLATVLSCGISTESATLPNLPNEGGSAQFALDFSAGLLTNVLPVGRRRINIAADTDIYLVAKAIFTVSTMSAYGYIGARRIGPYVS